MSDPEHDGLTDGGEDELDIDAWEASGGDVQSYRLSKNARFRLDKYVQNRVKGLSRNQIQKLITLEAITVNQKKAKASLMLKEGDVVDIRLPPKPGSTIEPEEIPLDILYEDEDIIVINKQAGIVVHPARSYLSGTMLNALAHHFVATGQSSGAEQPEVPADADDELTLVPGLSAVGADDARPGVVHRLDKNTTGVIVFAKRDFSHWMVAKQFEDRTNLKAYLAVVHGCPEPEGGAIDQPIGKHPTIKEAYAIRQEPYGKPSLTLYRVRERYKGYSLVELELKTGRTHQIRVHLSYLGHPIVGDVLYGGEPVGNTEITEPVMPAGYRPYVNFARDKEEGRRIESAAAEREDLIIGHPALHATLLRIRQPISDEEMTFTAPVHHAMRVLLAKLRNHLDDGPVVMQGYHVDLTKATPAPDG
ncbi:RluA family pseudouridine synthase [Mucisphaera calidilacus]|uniref:Pseudouridine synthase n=1 Tax=Mucisphaera calidilacus TaxID=2527982 RepID=A0A518BXK9_9BACT|nr:RluA family pseudouridine synthase [Mucisphaera calidilacus]QDU71717.1 Pseudouridine synthase [Mucisphaera calidilacus]